MNGAFAALAAGALATAVAVGAAGPDEETRATMQKLFASMQVLLPWSVGDPALRAEESRPRVHAAVTALATHAGGLAEHTGASSNRHLRRSLAEEARRTRASYERGELERAGFLVRQMTEYCIACHTRLPSEKDAPVASHFVEQSVLGSLPLQDRAELLMATRQFDDALGAFETLIGSGESHPAHMLGPITDYLTLSIRVKQDFDRPIPLLERFAKRGDLWRYLRADVESWIASLRELRDRDWPDSELEAARELVEEAKGLVTFPADRRALVHYVTASAFLHRWLAAEHDGVEAAEAYWLLGLTESRIGRDAWVSQAGQFLETSIRLAPNTETARSAYALLEEETVLGYTGSSGVHLPPEVARRLEELRRLADGG